MVYIMMCFGQAVVSILCRRYCSLAQNLNDYMIIIFCFNLNKKRRIASISCRHYFACESTKSTLFFLFTFLLQKFLLK